mgnify:CR=1 FL=1|tara:strand:- start:208 stop:510 length:303 start_codon:yes stop_codon:yes gene_type:complete
MSISKKNWTYLSASGEHAGQTFIGIKDTGTKYDGVVYKYGEVSVPPEDKLRDGPLPLSFKYDIVDSNGLFQEDFGEDFFKMLGDNLVEIIDEMTPSSEDK